MNLVKKVRNLTPHPVTIVLENGTTVTYEPEPIAARVTEELVRLEHSGDIPMFRSVYSEVVGLPEMEAGTFLIVSGLVCNSCPGRFDLVHPVGLVRDNEGRVVGCRGFAPNDPDMFDF